MEVHISAVIAAGGQGRAHEQQRQQAVFEHHKDIRYSTTP
jgi:hypothetical protein